MKAIALCFAPPSVALTQPKKLLVSLPISTLKCPPIKAAVANEPSTVDYSSMTSVFPAEACETVGGEACDVEMYPEAKPKAAEPKSKTQTTASESVDREYLAYDEPKTVFLGEACDDLGGEFCEPEYQTGVYK